MFARASDRFSTCALRRIYFESVRDDNGARHRGGRRSLVVFVFVSAPSIRVRRTCIILTEFFRHRCMWGHGDTTVFRTSLLLIHFFFKLIFFHRKCLELYSSSIVNKLYFVSSRISIIRWHLLVVEDDVHGVLRSKNKHIMLHDDRERAQY